MNRPSFLSSNLVAAVENDLEAAEDHPFKIHRHVRARLHPRIGHHLCAAFVTRLFRGPDQPGEDEAFALLCIDRAVEIGDLAVRHVVAPAFDHALRAMLEEELPHLGGHLAISLLLARRDRDHEAVNIGHIPSPPSRAFQAAQLSAAASAAWRSPSTAISIQFTPQIWPSGSSKLRPYMKSYSSFGDGSATPPAAAALSTIASTSSRLSAVRQSSTWLVWCASPIGLG